MRSSLQSALPPARLVKPRTCGTLARQRACDGRRSGRSRCRAGAGRAGRIRMPPRSSCESCRLPLTCGRAALVSTASAPLSEVSPSVAARPASETRPLPPVSELDRLSAPASRPAAIGLPSQLPSACTEGDLRLIVAFEREPGSRPRRAVVAGLDGLPGELEREPGPLLLQQSAQRRQVALESHLLAAPGEAALGRQRAGAVIEGKVQVERVDLVARSGPLVDIADAAVDDLHAGGRKLLERRREVASARERAARPVLRRRNRHGLHSSIAARGRLRGLSPAARRKASPSCAGPARRP